MKVTKVEISSRFRKSFRKLHPRIQRKTVSKIKIFKKNPFNPQLKTHSLSGNEKECWAFWVDYRYRIKFIFLNKKEVLLLDIGTHDIYK